MVLIAALLGLLAGGLVNILADDLPERGGLRAPHFPDGAPRPWLGVRAFLRGKRASPAGAGLSWRYPLVEIALAVAFGLLALAYPLDLQLIFYLFYACVFVLVTVIDLERRLILFVVMVPAGIVALLDAALTSEPRPTVVDSVAGGALGFGVFWLFWYGGVWFNRLRSHGDDPPEVAFGFGDVMLAAVCGLVLGWQSMIFAMFITVFAGALGGLVWMLSRAVSASGYAMFTALPYGPYIVLGTVVMLFFKEPVQALLRMGRF